ncbi:CatB-related O-acetyltransferase [Promethearchaeum syntrophicum]|uniref:CatB-related O-acetyltransferase n=1 Tax=Promethearchaeum syntrophicum TaxID=2594042 RepID=A0A5B9DA36_9ARCH|nr:CatB-related O-acetyltransferase [Candidatus Prometheoarchaeum syntrophicum]QEE16014.1 putative lipopolysaccharide biosynthesis O-acetyl transferase WbbJ [Candidatus Prometheoarchaeum syntrophicum]
MRMNNSQNPRINDSKIDKNCFFDIYSNIDKSEISQNTKIYKFTTIKNSIIQKNSSVGDHSKILNSYLDKSVHIGRYNHISGCQIGKHSYTGQNAIIMGIKIGNFCSISWGVTIGPGEHDFSRVTTHRFLYTDVDRLKPENEEWYNRFEKNIEIGHDVWIGANSTILRGVSIGTGSIIGANSLVNKNIPPYAIVGGNPAKIIKYRFSDENIQELIKIKWWNLPDRIIKLNFETFNSKITQDTIQKLKIIITQSPQNNKYTGL